MKKLATHRGWPTSSIGYESENAAIVSFNWDLVLDQKLFESGLSSAQLRPLQESYFRSGPVEAARIAKLVRRTANGEGLREELVDIFHHDEESECIKAFLHPRAIKSKAGRRYHAIDCSADLSKGLRSPCLPTPLESLHRCTQHAEEARLPRIFSPAADLHAQFIFRCGFHNQIEGRLRKDGSRHPATGGLRSHCRQSGSGISPTD